MIYPGLVSVTFRQLKSADIVNLAVQAGLAGIEWGGDLHVPHGDVKEATNVRLMTVESGLEVVAYGSYYRVGHPDAGLFEASLETAYALSAPVIRVWPGKQGTDAADEAYWNLVVRDSRRIADFAAEAGIKIAYEFHANTLTDTLASTLTLLKRVNHPNIQSLWQPPRYSKFEDNLHSLESLLPWLHHLHVFHWHQENGERLPLSLGADHWQRYLAKVANTSRDYFALLEFVQDDNPAQFLQDAATLREWLTKI